MNPVTDLPLLTLDPHVPPDELQAAVRASDAPHREWLVRLGRTPTVIGHRDANTLLRDRRLHHLLRHLHDVRASDDPALRRRPGSLLSAEGDEHLRLRRLCLPAFRQRSIRRETDALRATVRAHLDRVAPRRHVDLVSELCVPYPVQVIARILGAPEEDWPLFARWATASLSIFTASEDDLPAITASQAEMTAYVERLIDERRDRPGPDLLTDLIEAEEAGDRLTDEELVTLAEAILTGGSDTTRNQLASTVWMLLTRDRWRELVEHPERIPTAVEEALRLHGTIRTTVRVAQEDVEHRGVIFPTGSTIAFSLAAANLDPETHPDGTDLHLDRDPEPHLSFGSGIHFCLGAWLARHELEVAIEELVRAFPEMRLDGAVRWIPPDQTNSGPSHLPVDLGPRTERSTP